MAVADVQPALPSETPAPALGAAGRASAQLRSDRPALVGLGFLVLLVIAATAAPIVAPYDPLAIPSLRLMPPGTDGHLLGTDEQGRDVLSRLIWGARASLAIGIVPVVLSFVVGGAYGLVAGFYGGLLRTVMMRFMDVFFAFPAVLLAIAIGVVLGPGLWTPIIAITIVLIPALARVAEGVTVQVGSLEYVEAANASGASRPQVLAVHVLPNAVPTVVAYSFSMFAPVIVFAAGLSFLGLGVQAPQPEWGSMLSGLQQSLWVAPATAIMPGIPIMLAALAFDVVGNAVRDILDPRMS